MKYRMATERDLRSLAELRWEFHAEDNGELPAEGKDGFVQECEAFLRAGLAEGRWVYWVAEDEGRIVAHMFVQRVRKVPRPGRPHAEYGYLTNVYARPDHRNGGVGSALIARVKEWARAAGLEMLIVWPSERSVPFYRRAGFAPDGEMLQLSLEAD